MTKKFENIFKQISLLARMQLEGVGLKLNPPEELDYFCFCLITALSKENGHNIEHLHLQFIQCIAQKYGVFSIENFQLKQQTYQHYLSLSLQRKTLPSGLDPIMQLAYILSDQSVNPQFHVNMNIILLSMTIRDIIRQSSHYILSVYPLSANK
ncbi:hypothetical protein GCM10023206_33210 [Acinetobacter puyangensis]|uniref:Uncharacterized protein n=1 Tax=Acinetobacter puyangensis TaxID=1096779 RepID=A0A240EEQ4_9GAMM|nr:hypothetical protein [Acinetobacter puyangensis]SNX46445.1 hypothetical protein SAMN05421731_11213 [Acinetobacter puyangensis]